MPSSLGHCEHQMKYCTERCLSRASSFQFWESHKGSGVPVRGDKRLGGLGSRFQESHSSLLPLLQVDQHAESVYYFILTLKGNGWFYYLGLCFSFENWE